MNLDVLGIGVDMSLEHAQISKEYPFLKASKSPYSTSEQLNMSVRLLSIN